MKKVFARATYKRYLPEMMIYIAVWLIVLMVPVVSNFFELLSGKVEVMRWKGVFILCKGGETMRVKVRSV